MSIQKQAAELADGWVNSIYPYSDEFGWKMADLLRQIASMGGDVEPMTLQELDCYLDPTDSPEPGKVCSQQALDAARLDGFEAGRRNGLEDAASVCEEHKYDTQAHDLCRLGAKWCEESIRELINKES